ncbi:MAG: sigma-70 family RNA polymerase sigma factor [Bacillota bacterium]
MDAVEVLIRKSQNDDLAAFEQLVNLYQQRVYSLSYQLAGNHADAQDLAQEVFIKAYLAIKGFRNEADFGTWLHRITVNLWLNMKRRQNLVPVVSLDEPVQTPEGEVYREVAAAGGDPEQFIEDREFSDCVRLALDELSSDHKAALILRDIEGYSYEEMAAILNCSLGTVKSRLSRARQLLRQKVELIVQEAEGMAGAKAKAKAKGKDAGTIRRWADDRNGG